MDQDEDRQHHPVQRQEETLAPHQAKALKQHTAAVFSSKKYYQLVLNLLAE
jgi:hypothetical protein